MKTSKLYQFSLKSEAGWMLMSSFIAAGLLSGGLRCAATTGYYRSNPSG